MALLVLALAEFLHLDQVLFDEGSQAKIDLAQPHTLIRSQRTLPDLGRLTQTAQEFEMDFTLETSQFLQWRCEAQGDLGMLPPRRFTISKRVQ